MPSSKRHEKTEILQFLERMYLFCDMMLYLNGRDCLSCEDAVPGKQVYFQLLNFQRLIYFNTGLA